MRKILSSFVIILPFINVIAFANEFQPEKQIGGDTLQTVAVEATKKPALHPYRALSAGMDVFEEYHSLAPAASLRYRLIKYADANKYAINTDGLRLSIAGSETSVPLPITPDGTFILPRSQSAFDDNADLMLNRKKQLYDGKSDVRTPGVPANMRRLGDIRLECRVEEAVMKKEMNFLQRGAFSIALLGSMCDSRNILRWHDAPGRLERAMIVFGDRRQKIKSSRYSFQAPIADKSWPDDAMIEFIFAGPPSVDEFAQQAIYLLGSMNNWDTENIFDSSGFSVGS